MRQGIKSRRLTAARRESTPSPAAHQRGESHDVVITDLGIAVCGWAQGGGLDQDALAHTPVHFLTGWAAADGGERYSVHVDKLLSKPPRADGAASHVSELVP